MQEAVAQLRCRQSHRLVAIQNKIPCVFFSALSGVLLFVIAQKVGKNASGGYYGFVSCKFNLKRLNSLRSNNSRSDIVSLTSA